ncbi:hypothetical protein BE21_21365 [Sorangium cellulosum]|uniref:Colicin E3-like ribonuclease domain-containing protein n=1 Tax=Sorangium cellulosum TaxID=56 RepID=A0A150TWD4_SORCE|nr:hypothetical protein BE21_21365 [Sorangium cellulosum]
MAAPIVIGGIALADWVMGGVLLGGALWMSPAGKPARDATEKAITKALSGSQSGTCEECSRNCPVCGQPTPYHWPDVPDYVKYNLVPSDDRTILGGMVKAAGVAPVKGATVYKMRDGGYAHRDTFHSGKGAEIETYDKNGNHTGTICPNCGQRTGEADPKKRNILK